MRAEPVDEKSDVWPMGANIFVLLTGLFPYHTEWERPQIERIIAHGYLPDIDQRYRTRSFIEGRLVEIMELWYVSDDFFANVELVGLFPTPLSMYQLLITFLALFLVK